MRIFVLAIVAAGILGLVHGKYLKKSSYYNNNIIVVL